MIRLIHNKILIENKSLNGLHIKKKSCQILEMKESTNCKLQVFILYGDIFDKQQ